MRIAIIEDNPRLAGLIQEALEMAGIPADLYDSVSDAAYALERHDYRAIVLDRGLPDGDGLHWLRDLRRSGNVVPCLMLTARAALHDRVDGLESGADDYLSKPFAIEELVARVRALLRRQPATAPQQHQVGNLVVDAAAGATVAGGEPLALTAGEFRLLLALAEAAGGVVGRDQLTSAVLGPFAEVTPNSLEVAIHRLRRRLRDARAAATVVTERGRGYALKPLASR